ncbi:hypothetical protein B0H14DRAFT_2857301 [Mycena olivaceomarginata]|nr:hypothetical protein B0H14DRAFT_2857301 [Mycena olivaceomarginata]
MRFDALRRRHRPSFVHACARLGSGVLVSCCQADCTPLAIYLSSSSWGGNPTRGPLRRVAASKPPHLRRAGALPLRPSVSHERAGARHHLKSVDFAVHAVYLAASTSDSAFGRMAAMLIYIQYTAVSDNHARDCIPRLRCPYPQLLLSRIFTRTRSTGSQVVRTCRGSIMMSSCTWEDGSILWRRDVLRGAGLLDDDAVWQ